MASDDLRDDVDALRGQGSDLSGLIAGERVRPDGRVVRWRLAAAPELGRDLPPFLIEHDASSAEWTPAERTARLAGPARLTTLEIAVGDVSATIGQYLRTTGLRFRPSLAGQGARDATIGAQTLRIRPHRDPRIACGHHPSGDIRRDRRGRLARLPLDRPLAVGTFERPSVALSGSSAGPHPTASLG